MANEPNSVIIDLSALVYNLGQVKIMVGQGIKIMGVVKADAYGHGLVQVSKTLEKNGIDCLGVAYVYEALELRENGIRIPIVILSGILSGDEACEVVDKDLTPVLYDFSTFKMLDRESERQGKKTSIHLKIDTGMGRLGIFHSEIKNFFQRITDFKYLNLDALTSHFSSADEESRDFTDMQIKRFDQAVETGRSMGFRLPLNSLANSAGIMRYNEACFEMVRPGIALYGGLPCPEFLCPVPLRPVMSLKGQVLQIRDFPNRTPISYGRAFHTKGPRRIAVLSIGYADGLSRSLSNCGDVLIGGKRAPIVGRVCMNLTSVDITGIKDVETGDDAVFLGSQGELSITGDELAGRAGTISYEVFCSIGRLNGKEYVSRLRNKS